MQVGVRQPGRLPPRTMVIRDDLQEGYVQSSAELPGAGSLRPAGGPALAGELAELARAVTRDPADPLARSADPVAAAIAEAAAQIRQLHAALDSRDVIGQAKGILMERYRLTPDGAFALLARASQDTNVKLREVAAELCRTGTLPGHDDCRQLLAG
jgi:hypothetical protein